MNFALFPVTVADMLAEVERELAVRRQVYPRLIAERGMVQAKADRQIAVLEALAVHLRAEVTP
ncbi:MAG TPA: hypothetical protein VGI53_07420 [Dyella sp.]|jgi:hypothetical protein